MCALARSIDDAELLRLTRGDLLADGSRLARTRKGRAPTPLRRRRRYPARASLRLACRDRPAPPQAGAAAGQPAKPELPHAAASPGPVTQPGPAPGAERSVPVQPRIPWSELLLRV